MNIQLYINSDQEQTLLKKFGSLDNKVFKEYLLNDTVVKKQGVLEEEQNALILQIKQLKHRKSILEDPNLELLEKDKMLKKTIKEKIELERKLLVRGESPDILDVITAFVQIEDEYKKEVMGFMKIHNRPIFSDVIENVRNKLNFFLEQNNIAPPQIKEEEDIPFTLDPPPNHSNNEGENPVKEYSNNLVKESGNNLVKEYSNEPKTELGSIEYKVLEAKPGLTMELEPKKDPTPKSIQSIKEEIQEL